MSLLRGQIMPDSVETSPGAVQAALGIYASREYWNIGDAAYGVLRVFRTAACALIIPSTRRVLGTADAGVAALWGGTVRATPGNFVTAVPTGNTYLSEWNWKDSAVPASGEWFNRYWAPFLQTNPNASWSLYPLGKATNIVRMVNKFQDFADVILVDQFAGELVAMASTDMPADLVTILSGKGIGPVIAYTINPAEPGGRMVFE